MRAGAVALVLGVAAPQRRVFAWTHEHEHESAQQITKWAPLFDGVYVGYCGLRIEGEPERPVLTVGPYYDSDGCQAVIRQAPKLGMELHMWIPVPESDKFLRGNESRVDVTGLVDTIVEQAKLRNWSGVQIDDESQGCPRKDRDQFRNWMDKMKQLATGLHAHGVQLTAAVQAMSCGACTPWPACLSDDEPAEVSATMAWYSELGAMMLDSGVDRWLVMDTYYGKLPFFYDNLDFYAQQLFAGHPDRYGVGVLPMANPTDEEQTLARFHAVDSAGTLEMDVFRLPLKGKPEELYLPALAKWKKGRGACVQNGVLSYWGPCKVAEPLVLVEPRREDLAPWGDPGHAPVRKLRGP